MSPVFVYTLNFRGAFSFFFFVAPPSAEPPDPDEVSPCATCAPASDVAELDAIFLFVDADAVDDAALALARAPDIFAVLCRRPKEILAAAASIYKLDFFSSCLRVELSEHEEKKSEMEEEKAKMEIEGAKARLVQ